MRSHCWFVTVRRPFHPNTQTHARIDTHPAFRRGTATLHPWSHSVHVCVCVCIIIKTKVALNAIYSNLPTCVALQRCVCGCVWVCFAVIKTSQGCSSLFPHLLSIHILIGGFSGFWVVFLTFTVIYFASFGCFAWSSGDFIYDGFLSVQYAWGLVDLWHLDLITWPGYTCTTGCFLMCNIFTR